MARTKHPNTAFDSPRLAILLAFFGWLGVMPPTLAAVDENSQFLEARIPASELDVRLLGIKLTWMRFYSQNPPPWAREKYPLLTRVEVLPDIEYYKNKIQLTGWIMNLTAFLALNQEERKALVREILEALKAHFSIDLLDDPSASESTRFVKSSDFEVVVILNNVTEDENGKTIRGPLPIVQRAGQAAYQNNQFIFSEGYFLKLQVRNGRAIPRDGRVVVEKERK